jgi:hypothetical protein
LTVGTEKSFNIVTREIRHTRWQGTQSTRVSGSVLHSTS